jgi:hypothetical protein
MSTTYCKISRKDTINTVYCLYINANGLFMFSKLKFLLALAFFLAIYLYSKNHFYWPLNNDTPNKAFLNVDFGMSPEETSNALNKYGFKLIDKDEFRKSYPESFSKNDVYSLSDQNATIASLYSLNRDKVVDEKFLSSFDMYETFVVGLFCFQDNRLAMITLEFHPLTKMDNSTDSKEAFEQTKMVIASHLKRKYKYISGNISKDTFTLQFTGKNKEISFYGDLTDEKNSRMTLNIFFTSPDKDHEKAIKILEDI